MLIWFGSFFQNTFLKMSFNWERSNSNAIFGLGVSFKVLFQKINSIGKGFRLKCHFVWLASTKQENVQNINLPLNESYRINKVETS